MILIISKRGDYSTFSVIEYISYNNLKYIRINAEDEVKIKYCGLEISIEANNKIFYLSEIKSVWYRRGFLNIKNHYFSKVRPIEELQNEEISKLIQFIYYNLENIRHINTIRDNDVYKLIVSDIARKINISVPTDYIFSTRETIENKTIGFESHFITKVISGHCMQNFNNFTIYNYSSILDKEQIKQDNFFPSLVQNYIHKKYELRIFYLSGLFYTMAIMSQNDKQTTIDFRVYNDVKPNRNVPFRLPEEIEIKLDKLMQKLNLNCGSIDMIVTPENEYYFLEVNPVGQFGMTSYPCNYNLENKIAKYLADYEN
jgi:ATP-GRASP peptide maturase of grasp-with-spasm system